MPPRKKIIESVKKLVKNIRNVLSFNIATVLFGALFLYMLVTVVLYITSTHVVSYQVTAGPLARNPVLTGLAIRDEQVVTAESPGYIRYLARDTMKVRKNGTVYALTDTKAAQNNISLTEKQLEKVRSRLADFSNTFSGTDFHDTYGFKYEMQGLIIQQASAGTQGTVSSDSDDSGEQAENENGEVVLKAGSAISFGSQIIHTSPEAGLVVYSTDGYENKTADELTEEDFEQKSYTRQDLLTDEQIKAGSSVYKLITNDNWTLMIPVTDKQAATLADRSSIKVKFLKDGESQSGALSIVDVGKQKVAKIELKNGMVRYAADRFLKVELVVNTLSGLKIPMSSIVTKEFYLVPSSFLVQGDNGDESGFMRSADKNTTEFVSATIYKNTENAAASESSGDSPGTKEQGYCYVDKQTFQEGDVLHKPDSSETFQVGEIDYLEGVYSMNNGYAVFRQINILDQNEEYCIVSSNTPYGLEQFDRIVEDGDSVKEEDILTGK